MSQHLNRLNAEESLEWDEAYKRFCETGEWEEYKMKAFWKWYGELPMREDAEDFSLDTQAKYKKGWKAAFELMLEWLEIEEPFEVFQARIKGELENGTGHREKRNETN